METELKIRGRIIFVDAMQCGTSQNGKEWKRQGAVLETAGRYPKQIYFSLFGDNIPSAGILNGGEYEVSIEIVSREYQGKWYTNVNAYRMEPLMPTAPMQGAVPQPMMGQVPMGGVAPMQAPQMQGQAPQGQAQYGLEKGDPLPF